MSKCPFWSKKNEKVVCYSDCPMHPTMNNEEICPFVELSTAIKITYNEIVEEDYGYEKEKLYDFAYSKLGNY